MPLDDDHHDRDRPQRADQIVDLAAGFPGDGLVAVDFELSLQALRCQLVDPAEDQDKREAENQ